MGETHLEESPEDVDSRDPFCFMSPSLAGWGGAEIPNDTKIGKSIAT